MRLLLLTCAAAAVVAVYTPAAAQHAQGPWCAGQTMDLTWAERCTLPSFQACLNEVLAGNRGVCYRNPYWEPPAPTVRRKRR